MTSRALPLYDSTVYPKKYAHGFVVLCFVVVMQSFIMNSQEVFIHIHQGCFAGTGAIVRLPQCQWSKPDGYGKISQCITTTKHNKAKTVCIFLGIYVVLSAVSSHVGRTVGKHVGPIDNAWLVPKATRWATDLEMTRENVITSIIRCYLYNAAASLLMYMYKTDIILKIFVVTVKPLI